MVCAGGTENACGMPKTVQALSLAAVVLALSAVPASAEPRPAWGPCQGGAPSRQECATIDVPLDYRNPAGQEISLAISRISTAKPHLRRGVLLLIPGGPGNPGLSRPTTHGLKLPAEVLDRYDLVGFDPRGVGQSTPVSCELGPQDTDARMFLPWPGPGGDISGNVDRARRIAGSCVRNGGTLMQHINTRNEARDIDRIRQALGERRLSYWGTSYGTYAGAVYATMFPRRTDRIVLDSNGDPDPRRVARGWAANMAVGAEDRFPDFAAWAAARDSAYGLGSTVGSVRDTYLRLAAALDRTPRPDLTGSALRAIMFNTLYADAGFPLLAQLMHAARTGSPLPAIPLPPADQLQNLIAVQTATACNDVTWPPQSIRDYAHAVAQNQAIYPLTGGMPANIFACAFWTYPPAEPSTRVTSNGPSNILMIQNLRDPATPHAGALKMRDALGHRARLVTVDAGGHNAYLANGNACGDNTVSAFLAHGTRPDHDIRC
jgi:pimeloyl-ACP methyl ester carboxylesterase